MKYFIITLFCVFAFLGCDMFTKSDSTYDDGYGDYGNGDLTDDYDSTATAPTDSFQYSLEKQ